MSEALSALRITFFEIICYILPGGTFVALFLAIFTRSGLDHLMQTNLVNIFGYYLIGIAIHSVSQWVSGPKSLGWSIYHKIKEKKEGSNSGNPNPITKRGKLALALRRNFLEVEKNNSTSQALSDKLLESNLDFDSKNPIEMFKMKESVFYESAKNHEVYEHLQYHKILSRSLATVCLIYSIVIAVVAMFGDFAISLTSSMHIDAPYLSVIVTGGLLITAAIFMNRANYYKEYRSNVINNAIILFFNKKKWQS